MAALVDLARHLTVEVVVELVTILIADPAGLESLAKVTVVVAVALVSVAVICSQGLGVAEQVKQVLRVLQLLVVPVVLGEPSRFLARTSFMPVVVVAVFKMLEVMGSLEVAVDLVAVVKEAVIRRVQMLLMERAAAAAAAAAAI